jgi:fibronectin-binding autotransporter adhesin
MVAPLPLRRNARLILALFSNLFAISVLAGVGTTPALAQTTSTWSGGSGNWSPCPSEGGNALWDTCSNNVVPSGNFIAVINGGPVFATGASVVGLTIFPNDVLNLTPGYVDITGPSLSNQGTINIGASNGLEFPQPSQTTTISGAGTINLTDPNARVLGGSNAVINTNNTIQGQGYIGMITFTNQSIIDANVSGAQLELAGGGSITNTGTIQASNGATLLLQGSSLGVPFNNSGGTIQALTGSTVMVDAYAISGGTLVSTGSGLFSTFGGSGNPSLSNLTNNANYQIVSGGSSTIAGAINNLGTIQVKGGLFVNGSATLKGGSVPIAYPEGSIISLSGATTLINQSNIAGSGFIGDANLTFTNQGTVNATDSANPLVLSGSASNNTATMEASGGGTLQIQNTINNNGGTIEALSGSTVLVDSNTGVISGGTLKTTGTGTFDTNSGTLDGTANPVNNTGMFKVSHGNLVLQGTINNTGTIALDKAGFFAILNQPTILTGSGKVIMSPNTVILSRSPTNTLTNGSTIEGAGFIGSDSMGITNSGTIFANKTTPLVISPDATLGFTNIGKLMVNKGSTLNIAGLFNNFSGTTLMGGTYLVAGTLEFQNSIVTNAGSITLTGTTAQILNSFTNTSALANLAANTALGSLSLGSGQVLATATSFSNAGKATVGIGSGFSVGGSYTQTAGTTTLDGALMAPSGLTLQKGSLLGKGTIAAAVTSSASVTAGDSPSKPATLTVTGSYTQNSAGTLNISIGGTAVDSYGQVAVSNGVSLGGTLVIKCSKGFVPSIGNTFKIVTGSAVSGQFTTVKGTSINSGEHFEISYTPTAVTLTVVSGA